MAIVDHQAQQQGADAEAAVSCTHEFLLLDCAFEEWNVRDTLAWPTLSPPGQCREADADITSQTETEGRLSERGQSGAARGAMGVG
jgi:hypothetical protein